MFYLINRIKIKNKINLIINQFKLEKIVKNKMIKLEKIVRNKIFN